MAEISVIIPCYNVSSYIDRCLTSLVSQTCGLELLEIICIDDASTDDTWMYLKQWEQRFPQIMIIHCDENGRQGTARNIGMQYASAPWISFIDSDDWIEKDYCEKMYAAACFSHAEMVTCEYERDFSDTMTYFKNNAEENMPDCGQLLLIDTIEKRKLFIRMMSTNLTAWGKLIRRDFLMQHEIFFPEQLAYEDNGWGPLLPLYLTSVYKLPLSLYHYFVNQNSTILQYNADYHIDFLTVQHYKWQECQKRGFYGSFASEIEFDFLHSCYLDFFKIICLRYEPPSYSLFLLLKEFILQYVPNFENNPYFKNGFTEFQHMLLNALKLPITKKQFEEIASYVKQLGI